MALTVLPPPGLPVQEILDQILDFLDRARDLKSCAMASRSLTPRAQFHLFHDIILAKPNDDPRRFDNGAACHRLFSILATSPHLAEGDPSFAMLDLAHGLIALPSVRSVHIDVQKWPFERDRYPGFASRIMTRLFRNSTSHIEILKITSLGLRDSHAQEDCEPPALAASPPTTRASIKIPRVASSPEIGEYLINPGCPFDFSQIEDVQIPGSMTPAIHKILEDARFKIKRLECSTTDLTAGLKLERFPSLTHLTISGGGHDLPSIMNTALSNTSGNGIEKVVIDIQGNTFEEWEYDELVRMDSVLSSSIVMPALQKVDIRMYDLYEGLRWDRSKRNTPFSWSQLLFARGVFEGPAPTLHAQWMSYHSFLEDFN
ncbi:hypothetical protein B0H19DRAFT_1239228 [Mycena capillaripes]|nr:hypothetical protein B0H19DRAFT_1239228 [Mycena capillaripes]